MKQADQPDISRREILRWVGIIVATLGVAAFFVWAKHEADQTDETFRKVREVLGERDPYAGGTPDPAMHERVWGEIERLQKEDEKAAKPTPPSR
jgi:hypothetical protein